MAIESVDELKNKIQKLEARIKDTKALDNPSEPELARMELELRRLKNLIGDGVNTASEVVIPDNLTSTVNPNSDGSDKSIYDGKADNDGKKNQKPALERVGIEEGKAPKDEKKGSD